MKLLVLLILLFSQCCIAQENTLKIERKDICPDLFRDSKVDSTYSGFYTNDRFDTIYFNNIYCVQRIQIIDPYGSIRWRTKDDFANGLYEYNYNTDSISVKIKGKFKNGHLINGFEETRYSDGRLKSNGNYKNRRKSGVWKWYTTKGKLEQKIRMKNN